MDNLRTASFPWYDLPSVQWANDLIWQAMGYSGVLVRGKSPTELWHDPNLLISQACGLDLFLSDAPFQPLAAPVFDLDCAPGQYFSYLVGRSDGKVAAVNSLSSRSGYSALLSVVTPEKIVVTGSHLLSIAAVKAGEVDMAAIDAVTWKILARDTPELLCDVGIFARSADAPSPPYVVHEDADHARVLQSLQQALREPATLVAKKALLLADVVAVDKQDYASVMAEFQRFKV